MCILTRDYASVSAYVQDDCANDGDGSSLPSDDGQFQKLQTVVRL